MAHSAPQNAGIRFIKSSLCGGGECIEVAWLEDGRVMVRDSKDTTQRPLVFTQPEWQAFVQGVKIGEFDAHPS